MSGGMHSKQNSLRWGSLAVFVEQRGQGSEKEGRQWAVRRGRATQGLGAVGMAQKLVLTGVLK